MGGGVASALAATALLIGSLALRSDALLALPWVAWVGGPRTLDRQTRRHWVRPLLVVCASAVLFLLIQRGLLGPSSSGAGALTGFLRFFGPRNLVRGLGIFSLACGLVTVAVACGLVAFALGRRASWGAAVGPLLLLIPALGFWLRVPDPCRHFFYGLVGLAELTALLAGRVVRERWLVPVAGLIVVMNQITAETTYWPIVTRYPWTYPQQTATERRATGDVPLGWFVPNHDGVRAGFNRFRGEGQALARTTAPEVVAFCDQDQAMILAILERGQAVWTDTVECGFHVDRLSRPGQRFYLIEKIHYWPKDVAACYLAANPHPRAKIYISPITRSRYDKAPLPRPEQALIFSPAPR